MRKEFMEWAGKICILIESLCYLVNSIIINQISVSTIVVDSIHNTLSHSYRKNLVKSLPYCENVFQIWKKITLFLLDGLLFIENIQNNIEK